jgi:hypothetical protein
MSESLIGKKVLLKKEGIYHYGDKYAYLAKFPSKIIFEHGIIGLGGTCTFIGLENRGEIVIDRGNLKLFLWSDETGRPFYIFEEIN